MSGALNPLPLSATKPLMDAAAPLNSALAPVRSFAHAGLRFELTTGGGVGPLRMSERLARSLELTPRAPTLATVHLALYAQRRPLRLETARSMVEIAADGKSGTSRLGGGVLHFRELVRGTIAATLLQGPDAGDLDGALRSVRDSILPLSGGLLVHAAAVRVDSSAGPGAVLFVGRSGAGKSTAARLSGQPLFAADRVVLHSAESRVWAWRLPIGSPESGVVAAGEPVALPVLAILGVRQSSNGARTERLGRRRALMTLRAAVQAPAGHDELELLASCEAIASLAHVAEVHTQLGAPVELAPVLDAERDA